MSAIKTNSLFLKPQRKVRPLPKKSTKYPIDKESERATTGNKNPRLLTEIGNILPHKPNQQTDKPTMITRNRITTQTGIFNMAKVSKTVSRGPLTAQQDNSMMDQDDNSMITRVINQNSQQSLNQSFQNQEHTMMDISKLATPEPDRLAARHKPSMIGSQLDTNLDNSTKQSQDPQQVQQNGNNDIPFKEIEHNLLHSINPEDYLKRSNTLALIKRDLHTTIKRNIPHEIYSQFFKKTDPVPQPVAPSLPEKRNMPLQPSNLANLPNNQERKLSEWTMLMGSFSSQEDEDNCLAGKMDSKSNVMTMMDTDMPLSNLSQQSVGGFDTTSSKPDYLDSPTPVTMYPQKMF